MDHRCHPGGGVPSYCRAHDGQCVPHVYSFIWSALAWPWAQPGGSHMVLEQTCEQTASSEEIHAVMGLAGAAGKGEEGSWSEKSSR